MEINYIFGIGFNRSGTLTLTKYFHQLGKSTVHWLNGSVSKMINLNIQKNQLPLLGLEEWQVFFDLEHYDCDQPMGYFKTYQRHFKILERTYSNACFIFNFRNYKKWIKSLLNHPIEILQLQNVLELNQLNELFGNRMTILTIEYIQYISCLTVYQIVELLTSEYHDHQMEVLDYFKSKSDKLILFDLDEPLLSFQNLETKLKNFNWWQPNAGLAHINQGKTHNLSFMICCMNRTDHLKQTLDQTINDNLLDQNKIEIVVVHFIISNQNKDDLDLQQFILNQYPKHLETGYLKYIQNRDFSWWRPGGCRHTAFWYTRGTLVYNLDCDNYTGLGHGRQIIDLFNLYGQDEIIYLGFNGVFSDGSFGRICLSEQNHFKINSYPYNLPTCWSHDDSCLLLNAILKLKVRILTPNATNCLLYLTELISRLKNINNVNMLTQNIGKFGLIENSQLIPHRGISHSRQQSFKTIIDNDVILDDCQKLANDDIQLGYQYMIEQLQQYGDVNHLFQLVISYWQQNDFCYDLDAIRKNLIQTVYLDFQQYQIQIKHQKMIYYTILSDTKQLSRVINLVLTGFFNKIILAVLVLIDYPVEKLVKYPACWLKSDESHLDKLVKSGHILVKISPKVVIINRNLLFRINKLLNQSLVNTGIVDSNQLILVKKNSPPDNQLVFDFLATGDIMVENDIVNLKLQNWWLVELLDWSWIIWGDPICADFTNIGPNEQSRRRDLVNIVDNVELHCRLFGIEWTSINDQTAKNFKLGNSKTVILTYGLNCHNHLIPISQNTIYLIWQPDQSFPIDHFPINQTLVIAYYTKTKYPTFILSKLIDYLALFRQILRIQK